MNYQDRFDGSIEDVLSKLKDLNIKTTIKNRSIKTSGGIRLSSVITVKDDIIKEDDWYSFLDLMVSFNAEKLTFKKSPVVKVETYNTKQFASFRVVYNS